MKAAAPLFFFVALFAATSANAHIDTVRVQDFSFIPQNLSVSQGDTVRWVNAGGTHNVHHDCSPALFFNGNPSSAAWTYQFVFNAPALGTYRYHCDAHLEMGMVGTITVQRRTRWTVYVGVGGSVFRPQNITVTRGDTITWIHPAGAGTHNVHHTGVPTKFHSGSFTSSPFTYIWPCSLSAPATLPYICELHGIAMSGTVNAVNPAQPPQAPDSVVISVAGSDILLDWPTVPAACGYVIFRGSDTQAVPFTYFAGSTVDTFFVDVGISVDSTKLYYQVRALK